MSDFQGLPTCTFTNRLISLDILLTGGAHHTSFSFDVSSSQLLDFAEMAGIESLLINAQTRIQEFKKELR